MVKVMENPIQIHDLLFPYFWVDTHITPVNGLKYMGFAGFPWIFFPPLQISQVELWALIK